jgi:NAD(P)-dependent dehydrogenase (short-subunit alcohol dehydrogenase family)
MTEPVVFVTGAARGIGAATARRLAANGARLALAGLEPDLLRGVAADLPGSRWFECDVTDQAAVDRAVAGTVEEFGRIDVVVTNAGIANNGTVAITPVDALVRTIEVNLLGTVRTVAATLPHVTGARGYYLLVASAAAFTVLPGMAAYCASKGGVEQFGNALRLEVAHKGVGVGVAYMTWIDTDLVRDVRADLPSFDESLSRLPGPLGRYTPVEVCADAFARAIAARREQVFVPRSLGTVSALRAAVSGRLARRRFRREAAQSVPQLEDDVRKLGRSFGAHSTEQR